MDDLRERFEARQRLYDRDLSRHTNGAYVDARTETGWLDWEQCWKESRAALVVELPPTITTEDAAEAADLEDERAATVAHMVNGAIAACGAFIKAAGVRVAQ